MSNPKSVVGAQKRADTDALASELATLSEMDAVVLRTEWRRLYRSEPPKRVSRDLLELGVAWKLQERMLGGLSATMKRQLAELARTMAEKSDLPVARIAILRPGARLIREWNGETHEVLVVEGRLPVERQDVGVALGHRARDDRHALVGSALFRSQHGADRWLRRSVSRRCVRPWPRSRAHWRTQRSSRPMGRRLTTSRTLARYVIA